MTRVTMATAGVSLFALGAIAGHYAAPARVVTVERAVTSEQDVRAASQAVATAARAEAERDEGHERIRIVHVIDHPDGGTETTTEERTIHLSHAREATEETKAETKTVIEYRDRIEYRERERIVESQTRSNWSAAALIGLRADRSEAAYGGVVMRRLVGPVEAGAWATRTGPEWAGGLAIGARW